MKRVIIMASMVLILCACSKTTPVESIQTSDEPVLPQESVKQEEKTSSIRLVAVGDNLIHDVIYQQAKANAGGDGYDFSSTYQYFAPLLNGADIAMINQETPIDKNKPPHTYPLLNSPAEVADELARIGFNVVTQANNHMLDQGESGLKATLEYWNKLNIPVTGAYNSTDDMLVPRVVEKNGIKVAFIGITQHTNGLSLYNNSEIKYVLCEQSDLIKKQIEAARKEADFIVVTPHWGEENTFEPSDFQIQLSQSLADWGADLIIGHHPHVIQPTRYITASDGRDVLVVYSLGNFISAMSNRYNMLGTMLDVSIKKDSTGTYIESSSLVPLVTHYYQGMKNTCVYPLDKYDSSLAESHGVKSCDSGFSYKYMLDSIQQVYGKPYEGKPIEIRKTS